MAVRDQARRAALLIAFATAGFAAAPARAATEAGSSEAVIVTPLSLVNTAPLAFGNIIPGATGGTVTINQNSGARSSTGGVTLVGGMVSRASFTGLTGGWGIIIITNPNNNAPLTLNRVGGGATMTVTALTLQGAQIRWPGPGQVFSFAVGGTLAVGANQMAGTYNGTFNVTVNYF